MKGIYLLATLITAIWGSTFVTTKLLLLEGLTPMQIMLYRFVGAYICMAIFAPRPFFAERKRDELLLVAAGVTGGSLYFVTENSALNISLTSNVAIIIAATPILTLLVSHLFVRGERLSREVLFNSLFAFIGVVLVVCNGHFVLQLDPIGDLLAFVAALSWAVYSVILKIMGQRGYGVKFVTRKVFAYGILTLLPLFLIYPIAPPLEVLLSRDVIVPLLYLSIMASFFCYWVWSYIVERIGAMRSSTFIYIVPVVSLILAALMLNEPITPLALLGMGFILFGVVRTNLRKRR